MSNLNISYAQEADLRSRVSDTGLFCDSPSGAPDSKDVDAFRLAMKEEHFFSRDRDAFGRPLADESYPDSSFPVESKRGSAFSAEGSRGNAFPAEDTPVLSDEASQTPLSTLFSMVNTFNEVAVSGRVEAVHAVLTEEELNILVERILVSAADDGTQEVRLILNERFLSGTEIVLSRNLEGQLVVALNCIDQSTFQTLVASQFDLKAKLEEHELIGVEVTVNIDQEDSDSDRRSRGYYALDPDELWKTDDA